MSATIDPEFRIILSLEGQAGPITVLSVEGKEELGQPFQYTVGFQCADVTLDQARGSTAIVELSGQSFIAGIVESIRVALLPEGRDQEQPRFTLTLRPEPYTRLHYRRGFRIWQDLDVVALVSAVFEEAHVPESLIDWSGVTGTYPPRTFTVQYDESLWDFVNRLLQEEGIYYCFTHDVAGHVMVLMDSNAAAVSLEPAELPLLSSDTQERRITGIWGWRQRAQLKESRVMLRDFDFERPSLDLSAEVATEAPAAIEREHYAYPGYFSETSEGARLAQVRLDAFGSDSDGATCRTNLLSLLPGRRFEATNLRDLEGDEPIGLDRLVIATRLQIGGPGLSEFSLEVDTQSFEQTYRSLRYTTKPKVLGLQTAMVAGPEGEEIHVDEFGRVKVQFHWDRQGRGDERASCWMRVTQAHTTGSIMIPRIGWEVLVEFVDGDPDRPIVLGRVYNPNTTPPHALPACKTYTSHASVSSPGGTGTNEVVMDDTSGSEKLTLNAHYDYDLVVAHNRMLNIGANLATTVSSERRATIGGDEQRAIGGNQTEMIGGTHQVEIGGGREVKVTGTAAQSIGGSMTLTTGSEDVQVGSPAAAVLQVLTDAAINAAVGKAASAAQGPVAALMGPIAPALGAARSALGAASQFAGPAQALLGSPNPTIAAISQAAGSLSNAAGAASAGSIATGMAQAALSSTIGDSLRAALSPDSDGGGTSRQGSNGGPTGPGSATSGGSGNWGLTVGGGVSESVGGVAAFSSAKGIAVIIGGDNTETIGAARIELVGGGKSETVALSKLETVGVYKVEASESYGIDAKAAMVFNIAGAQSNDVAGGHSIAATRSVTIASPSVSLKASGKITLACGACKVIIDGRGISLEGASELKIEGRTIKLPETALGT